MPFKPFAHLARVSLAKGITHAYAPSAVVAGQSLGGQLHNYPANKFGKATHLQNAFSGPSSSGTGSKAGYTSQSSTGDGGLGQYYAAWQHAQQTGDDKEWKQHQFARRIGWKESAKSAAQSNTSPAKHDSIRTTSDLKSSARAVPGRSYSETALLELQSADASPAEAEALAKIDEAIAQEIKDVNAVNAAKLENDLAETSVQETEPLPASVSEESSSLEAERPSPSTQLSSPILDESFVRSETIVDLGLQHRFAEIPQHFESMVRDGLVPTTDAYNQIIISAIHLSNGYQPFPRALEVYGDMVNRSVIANKETYITLISFLTNQSIEASHVQKDVGRRLLRYAGDANSSILPSVRHQHDLYIGDTSLQFATKFYNIAVSSVPDFSLQPSQYNRLLKAYARNGNAQLMRQLLSDMKEIRAPVALEAYTVIIDACTSVKDLETAKSCYAEYRDRAIGRILEPMDVKVYVSLIRAYYAVGDAEKGTRFYKEILRSFEGSADKPRLTAQVTDAFVVDALVAHFIERNDYSQALDSLSRHAVTETARGTALNKICTAAADGNHVSVADDVFARLRPDEVKTETVMAVAAMHLRAGRLQEAQSVWNRTQQWSQAPAPDTAFAVMYSLALINDGQVQEALSTARHMFRQIRSVTPISQQQMTTRLLDEAIGMLARHAMSQSVTPSAQVSVLIFRLMIENGGLVSRITEDAIARVGPECVDHLHPQDIALTLHVQAFILPVQPSRLNDTAHAARFSHLLETVMARGIAMDPSTVQAVTDAFPQLNNSRPDLERRWRELASPPPQSPLTPQLISPVVTPLSPVMDQGATYDPYANTTDFRASRFISELLDSTTGRVENHVHEAMSRLRNVRRMGRHLQYGTYAKLVGAAGKAKQQNLMLEILSMAQTDVPFNAQIPTVKAGWIQIYDSMIAACLTTGDRQLAAKYHQDLLAMGAAPSANTFGIYITTLEGTFDEASEAVKIFQQAMSEGVTPSVFLFNAVIGKLGKARRIDDCLQYFGQMQNLGIRPSSVTYGTLVNALCRTSEEQFAVDMFEEMEAAPNYRPRPAPYNSIIQYFLNTKRDRSKVLAYYGRMRSKNIKPTSHTYKLLIESYATLEPVNLTAADAVLEDMKANGVQPEAVHYGTLIHAKGCVTQDMAGARNIFDAVLADKSIRATDNLYQNLLEAMVANHQVENSDEILRDMKTRGIVMTPYIANTLIHGWAAKGDIAKARSIFDNLGSTLREPSTYEAMTRAFLAADDHDSAQAVVAEMLKKGYPSAVTEKVLSLVGGA